MLDAGAKGGSQVEVGEVRFPQDEEADHELGAAEDDQALGTAEDAGKVQTGVEELEAASGGEVGGGAREQATEDGALLAHAHTAFAAL